MQNETGKTVKERPHTTIKISLDTRDRIVAVGRKGETYDWIINRLLDFNNTVSSHGSAD